MTRQDAENIINDQVQDNTTRNISPARVRTAMGAMLDFSEDNAGGSLPPGGATGEALVKTSAADGDAEWADIGFAPNLIFKTKTTIPTVLSTKADLEAAINSMLYRTNGVVEGFKIVDGFDFEAGMNVKYIYAQITGRWIFPTAFLLDDLNIISVFENTMSLYLVNGNAFKGCTNLISFASYSPGVQTNAGCFDTHYENASDQIICETDFIIPHYQDLLGSTFYETIGLLIMHGYYIGYVGPNDPGFVQLGSRVYLSRLGKDAFVKPAALSSAVDALNDAIDAVNNNIPSDVGNDIFNYYNFS